MDLSIRIAQDIDHFLEKYYIFLLFDYFSVDYRCTKCNRVYMLGHVANCSHVFCQNCRRNLGDGVEDRKCPSCYKPILKMNKADDLEFQRNVSLLRVSCPFQDNGCGFLDTVKDAVNHVKNCEYVDGKPKMSSGMDTTKIDQKQKEEVIKSKIEKLNLELLNRKQLDLLELKKSKAQKFELRKAASRGDTGVASNLIASGADVNAADYQRVTPLHLATNNGHFDMVKLLVEAGANVNLRARKSITPLHLATREAHCQIVTFLLINKANVNITRQCGITALHWAARKGHVDVMEILLSHKANVNAKCDDGASPLHVALRFGKVKAAEMLLRHGADVFDRDSHDTVLHEATVNVDILKMILEEMKCQCKLDEMKMKDAINAQDREGDTPLMWAAEGGRDDVAKVLLQCHGIDVNVQNFKGRTALHWAAKKGFERIGKLLTDNGADSGIRDKNGQTAMDLAQVQIEQKNRITTEKQNEN